MSQTSDSNALRQAYQVALEGAGVPVNLAGQCADVLVNDDASKPNLGRSAEDQHLIDSSMEWMKAKGVFNR